MAAKPRTQNNLGINAEEPVFRERPKLGVVNFQARGPQVPNYEAGEFLDGKKMLPRILLTPFFMAELSLARRALEKVASGTKFLNAKSDQYFGEVEEHLYVLRLEAKGDITKLHKRLVGGLQQKGAQFDERTPKGNAYTPYMLSPEELEAKDMVYLRSLFLVEKLEDGGYIMHQKFNLKSR